MNKLVIKQQDFNGLVAKLCRDITLSGWQPDYIVGLTRGGLIPAVMISHYLNIPMYPLSVSLRDSATGPESNLWMAQDALGHTDKTIDPMLDDPMSLLQEGRAKDILIVDDINDTGATFNWIMKDWPSGCFPGDPTWENDVWNQNVKFAVLVDNLASKCDVKMDYVGMEVNKAENDVWVDFPWEDWWTK
jgi:hypoxanthine-guanine phosphoribosyltransferase